jgi:hypothetical protein
MSEERKSGWTFYLSISGVALLALAFVYIGSFFAVY